MYYVKARARLSVTLPLVAACTDTGRPARDQHRVGIQHRDCELGEGKSKPAPYHGRQNSGNVGVNVGSVFRGEPGDGGQDGEAGELRTARDGCRSVKSGFHEVGGHHTVRTDPRSTKSGHREARGDCHRDKRGHRKETNGHQRGEPEGNSHLHLERQGSGPAWAKRGFAATKGDQRG